MTVEDFANGQRPWAFPQECDGPPAPSAVLSTDRRPVAKTGRRLLTTWSGPWTDRARLDINMVQVGAYPAVLKLVLSAQWGEKGEAWDVATATVTYLDAMEAQNGRPVFVVGGYPSLRWSLFAWLDAASASESGVMLASLFVDRGGVGAPFLTRATGVAP